MDSLERTQKYKIYYSTFHICMVIPRFPRGFWTKDEPSGILRIKIEKWQR